MKNFRLPVILALVAIPGVLLLLSTVTERSQASDQPYVLLISLDGFRWDFIERGLSPNLERIAGEGVSALSLESVFPTKTFPAHYSIITGMYVENHGMIANSFIDLSTGERFTLRDRDMVENPKYYQGEAVWETLRRHGIVTASYFWAGSEVNDENRRPHYFHRYDHERPNIDRIEGVIEWLQLPESERPRFITLYFSDVDAAGHRAGPDSDEVNRAIGEIDELMGLLLDRLEAIGMRELMNIIVVSDHGMTAVSPSRVVNVGAKTGGYDVITEGVGPVMMIQPERPDDTRAIYDNLKRNRNHFSVYLKEDMPGHWHYSAHPFILPIVVVADIGWSLSPREYDPARGYFASGGNHGYDNKHLDMHGIFYAKGPAFKSGYRTGTIRAVDMYPLIMELFGLQSRSGIDGDLHNVIFLLREDR
jgi:ectonucleotide pyrophosphatase/phosphodiesterase family member 5